MLWDLCMSLLLYLCINFNFSCQKYSLLLNALNLLWPLDLNERKNNDACI